MRIWFASFTMVLDSPSMGLKLHILKFSPYAPDLYGLLCALGGFLFLMTGLALNLLFRYNNLAALSWCVCVIGS